MDKNGTFVQTRNTEVCKNPIGDLYVRTYLAKKFDDIRSPILKSYDPGDDAPVSSDPHVNFQVFLFSSQSRFEFWLLKNSIQCTDAVTA